MYKKISDYGVIGNFHSLALIGLDGSIDWMCLPHLYSPSVFGTLLDSGKGGRFAITPSEEHDSIAEYLKDTNVLATRFRTRSGEAELTDFMTIPLGPEEKRQKERHEMYRRLSVIKGDMRFRVIFEPRLDYARAKTELKMEGAIITVEAHDKKIYFQSTHPFSLRDGRAEGEWILKAGEIAWVHLRYGLELPPSIDPARAESALRQTTRYWRIWAKKSVTGMRVDLGPYVSMVNRSALILKLLYFRPAGTMAAAATTSLPESIRGERNWDYRYSWLRDTFFTLEALFNIGHTEEGHGFFGWIERLIKEYGPALQTMYGLDGETELPEKELIHLDGYKGSRPVRIGNRASRQLQLDIYGEILNTVFRYVELTGRFDRELWPSIRQICGFVCAKWTEKDSGIWEMRSGPYHFVYSKVMCWVALDRAIRLSDMFGLDCEKKLWATESSLIKKTVLEKGWHPEKQAFVQHFDSEAMDASNLLIPIVGFLPYDDHRVISTVEAIKKELSFKDCFFYRYNINDGFEGKEGAFLLCSFWYIHYLTGRGRLDEAEIYLRRMETVSNHLGLFSEEYDPRWRELLGNFPQAFTHLGYLNSVIALRKAREKQKEMIKKLKEATG